MIPDWLSLTHPIEMYGVLALAGSCLLYAFIVHLEMRTLSRRGLERHERLENRLALMAEAAERMQSQLEETERPAPAAQPGQSLNLNKRGQVLRMRRRGETPETIAAALRIPQNEVTLLLKVHELSREHVSHA
ncbi:MAG TPA: hypothetical protein VNH83_09145 [Bryobacteraceae bacterium]|nr:hypothetical protein [Bryobacteraceae bacterium]